jgi:hypothetical protein
MPMFTAPENVEACSQLANAIMRLIDATGVPKPVAVNAVLNALAAVVAENAAARGADPTEDAVQWAAHLRHTVELNLRYPRGLS